MKTKAFCVLLGVFLLGACGPIIGGLMVAGSGVKEVTLIEGDLADLRSGSRVAVLGPFDKTAEAFYICRGEESAGFASDFSVSGLFQAELALDNRFPEQMPNVGQWRGLSPEVVQSRLGLKIRPDLLMSGSILKRQMVAAPMQGVLMDVTYRLDFLDLVSNQMVSLEVRVKDLYQEAIPAVVAELQQRIGI